MKILVINSGSSSIRFRIMDVSFPTKNQSQTVSQNIMQGAVHGIGDRSRMAISIKNEETFQADHQIEDHEQAFTWMFDTLQKTTPTKSLKGDLTTIEAIGHRVVHGGDRFSASTLIDQSVLHEIEGLNELAPLHNPACLTGIYQSRAFFKDSIPMVAVFDTMFHQTIPAYAAMYAIPYELAEQYHIKRYGFHGIAHASLASGYAKHTGKALSEQRLITLQLGNGCSITAIAYGKSIDTSMGFTPCEGLMMGTRSGDVDPSIISYLMKKEQVPAIGVQNWLNEHSGLLGVSGQTNDMRQLLQAVNENNDTRAQLAIDMFCYRIRKYLGAYLAALGGADAIVFGGGIGEGAPSIRTQIFQGMEWYGLKLHDERNQTAIGLAPGEAIAISSEKADIATWVIGTDEETMIADESYRCLMNH